MRLAYRGVEIIVHMNNGVFEFESAGVSSLLKVKTDCKNINIMDLCKMVMQSEEACADKFSKWIVSEAMPKFYADFIDEGGEENLHRKVVAYIRREHQIEYLIPGLGELQDTEHKRLVAYYRGYRGGQPDLMIPISCKQYTGFAIEFKTPKGKGKLAKKQKTFWNL